MPKWMRFIVSVKIIVGRVEEKLGKSRKEKPHLVGTEKKRVSAGEHELIVGVPVVVRFRPVVVQPQTVSIAFHVENVGIAVTVRIVRGAITTTACLVHSRRKKLGCILYRI